MKANNLLIVAVFLSTFTFANAQYCDINTVLGSTVEVWDWRNSTITYYDETNSLHTITSPYFIGPGFDNVGWLAEENSSDFQPGDGWELVFTRFGSSTDGVKSPAFCLYNRYESKLRIFYFIEDENIDNISVSLKYYNDLSNYVSAALDLSQTPTNTMEGIGDFNYDIRTINVFRENAGIWVLQDVAVAYDPCTCVFSTEFRTSTRAINEANFELNLTGGGTIEQIFSSQEADDDANKYSIDNLIAAAKKGYKRYDDGLDLQKGIATALTKIFNDKISADSDFKDFISEEVDSEDLNQDGTIKSDSWQAILGLQDKANQDDDVKETLDENGFATKSFINWLPGWVLDGVPFANVAIGLLDFFAGGGKEKPVPLNFNVNLEFEGTGTIPDGTLTQDYAFYNPGSDLAEQTSEGKEIVYNNVLGIINLMEDFNLTYEATNMLYFPGDPGVAIDRVEFNINSPLKYAFNPASGLELVEENVRAALYFNEECVPSYDASSEHLIKVGDRWRTPYVPIACLENYTTYIEYVYYFSGSFIDYEHLVNDICKPTLHLVSSYPGGAMFNVMYDAYNLSSGVVSGPNFIETHEVIQTTNIFDIVNQVTTGKVIEYVGVIVDWNNPQDPSPDALVTITVFPDVNRIDKDLSDQVIANIESILQKFNVYNPGQTRILLSEDGKLIILDDNGYQIYGVEITEDGFSISISPDCGSFPPLTFEELRDFCTDPLKYNPIAAMTVDTTNEEQPDVNSCTFKLFPNPASEYITLSLTTSIEIEEFMIEIYDSYGVLIFSSLLTKMFEGMNNIKMPISDLIPGVYYLNCSTNSGIQESLRFIKM